MKLNVSDYLHLSIPPCFQFTKKTNNLKFGKVLFGRSWLFTGGLWPLACSLWLFAADLWSFAGGLWWFVAVCGRLLVVCGCL